MLICVAGPYRAPSQEQRAANLRAMNQAAAAIIARGHRAFIGVNAALPILEAAGHGYAHPWMMEISLALAARCDAGAKKLSGTAIEYQSILEQRDDQRIFAKNSRRHQHRQEHPDQRV